MSREHILEESFSSDEDFDEEDGSESDSNIDEKLQEEDVFDIEFLKCYSALKKKDQKIYDENVKFFTEPASSESDAEPNLGNHEGKPSLLGLDSKSHTPKMTLLDHQLNLQDEELEQEAGSSSAAKVDLNKAVSKSFYEKELEEIKKSIEQVGEEIDSDDDWIKVRGTDEVTSNRPKRTISSILDKIEAEEDEDIKHLKQVWTEPEGLSREDRYLRDYILNKRYLASHADKDSEDEETQAGFFSKNLDEISDEEKEPSPSKESKAVKHHSDEKDFDKIARIPRDSTKTIRDIVEKTHKKEKRLKKVEKEKKKKKALENADCEDIVGDMPIRFHYRETEPNDYGLSAEELLMATDEELDKWIKLNDCVAYKTREEELAQKKRFEAKRNDVELKRKIFKSIYGKPETNDEEALDEEKKTKKRKRKSESDNPEDRPVQVESPLEDKIVPELSKRKKKKRRGLNHKKFAKIGVAPDRLLSYGLSKTKLKKSKLL